MAFNRTRSRILASRVLRARTALSRARGLLGRGAMAPDEGLWITPCSMIHTFFMRFPIDALFLDAEGRVLRVLEDLRPWRLSPWTLRATSVLELAGGALQGAAGPGDLIEIS